eukprot:jgi/Mesvir1/16223/Mv08477-RA.1
MAPRSYYDNKRSPYGLRQDVSPKKDTQRPRQAAAEKSAGDQSRKRLPKNHPRKDEDDAAIVIQRAYRGHLARRKLATEQQAATKLQAVYKGYRVRRQLAEEKKAAQAARVKELQRKARQNRIQRFESELKVLRQQPARELDAWQRLRLQNAATMVQKHWRRHVARKRMQPQLERRRAAATLIQARYRGLVARRQYKKMRKQQHSVAGSSEDGADVRDSQALAIVPSRDETRGMLAVLSRIEQRRRKQYAGTSTPSEEEKKALSEQVKSLHGAYMRGKKRDTKAHAARQRMLHETSLTFARLSDGIGLWGIPDDVDARSYPLPPAGERLRRAKQEHIRLLAEARVGSKWWKPMSRIYEDMVRTHGEDYYYQGNLVPLPARGGEPAAAAAGERPGGDA